MILDMNINLDGIDEEFLEELEELIEDTRVEYFIVNPSTKEELERAQALSKDSQRFKYTLPLEFLDLQDENCVAIQVKNTQDLEQVNQIVVIDSSNLNEELIGALNEQKTQGIILNAKQGDEVVENFALSLSKTSVKQWEQKVLKDIDYNRLALQSDYPEQSYDEFLDEMLKEISDMTFRAEQTIAAGGTRTLLKMFELL